MLKYSRYKGAFSEDTKLYASEGEFASNPFAIYKTIRNLVKGFKDVKGIMTENRYEGTNSSSL